MPTNLERWFKAFEHCESSDLVIEWNLYGAVSAAIARNVAYCSWPHHDEPSALYPNLYVIIVGPPGAGKSLPTRTTRSLFRKFGGFEKVGDYVNRPVNIAPNSMTIQVMWQHMALMVKVRELKQEFYGNTFLEKHKKADGTMPNKVLYVSTPLAVFESEELSSFIKDGERDTVSFLQAAYDCGDFDNITKNSGKDYLKNVCMAMFACTNPAWIVEATKWGLLSQGLAARAIFVWTSGKRKLVPRFFMDPEGLAEFNHVAEHIRKLISLYGKMEPTPEALDWFNDWYVRGGENPINKSPKCIDYYARKRVHLIKLAMVMHLAEHHDLTVTVDDFKRALSLLNRTEREMHKALAGSGKNPAYDVADKILQIADSCNGAGISFKSLFARVYDICEGGRATFEEALTYLTDTDQLVADSSSGTGIVYHRNNGQEQQTEGVTNDK